MITGRTPCIPVIGDTVLLRASNRHGGGVIVDTDAIRYRGSWRDGRGQLSWYARRALAVPDATTHGDGRDVPVPTSAHDRSLIRSLGGSEVKFHIGDKVKLGSTRIGTITDVGTVLIQVKTSDGSLRVVCPWEVVRIPG
jgi:hypothetical protein